eukprot:scaffold22792_cov94-Skeletonema_marinoi.AAC.2
MPRLSARRLCRGSLRCGTRRPLFYSIIVAFIPFTYLELYCREKLVDGKGKEKDEAAEKKEKSERKNLCTSCKILDAVCKRTGKMVPTFLAIRAVLSAC